MDPLKHEMCVHSDYQGSAGFLRIWNYRFLLKNPQILSIIRSTLTSAESARNGAKTKVGGVLKTSGKIWNGGVKI